MRKARTTIATVVAAGATLTAGALAGPALATTARPAGRVTVESCGSVVGTLSHTAAGTVLTATLSGCTGYTGAVAGSGTLVASLSPASSGTFTITWPAAAHLNPSTGTLGVTGPDAQGGYAVGGSITGGAFAGAVARTSLAPARDQATGGQPVTNTAPLEVTRNNW